MSTRDLQIRNLEKDLRELEKRYEEHPDKANLRRIMGVKRELRELKQGHYRNPIMARRRRRSRRRNPIHSGEFFLFALGTAAGVVGLITYQNYIAPRLQLPPAGA